MKNNTPKPSSWNERTAGTYQADNRGKMRRVRRQASIREAKTDARLGAEEQGRMEMDHTVPLFRGGSDEGGMLRPLPKPEHRVKTREENIERRGRSRGWR